MVCASRVQEISDREVVEASPAGVSCAGRPQQYEELAVADFQVELAQLELPAVCRVVDIRAVDVGQYLNAGTVAVTLQALDPIYVDFFLPQQALMPPFSIGFVSLIGFALMAPVASFTAPYGARLAHALSKRHLEIAFGCFLLSVCVRFMVSLVW